MTLSLALGQRYPGMRPGLPDVSLYTYDVGGHQLLVLADRPNARERGAFRAGSLGDVAVLIDGPAVVLCWRLGGGADGWLWPWSEAPYAWHLTPPERRAMPPAEDEHAPATRAVLHIVLVDTADATVRGLRLATLSPEVTAALHRGITAQAAAPWDLRAYDAHIARMMREESSALAARAQARCALGG